MRSSRSILVRSRRPVCASTMTLALCLATSALFACSSDDDDDGDDNNNAPITTGDAGVNPANNGLDSSVPNNAGDAGALDDLLGDADIGDFFSDGSINQDAVCTRFPQVCVDGSVVIPGRGDGGMFMRPDGGFNRDGGMGRRDGGRDGDAAEPSEDAASSDAASEAGP